MSRTSLGQKHQLRQREDIPSLKQIQSVRRPNYQQQFQTQINLYEQVEYFLHMKDRYLKVQKENRFMDFQRDYGDCYSNIKDGYGISIFKNGDRYIGFWQKNTMHGMGIYIFKTSDEINRVAYLGEFHYGKFHGIGKMAKLQNQTKGEIIYRGTWVDGKKSEQGVYFYQNPTVYYQGGWLQDEKNGEGRLIFPNGQYLGQWQNNLRHGLGKLKKVQSNFTIIYDGNWQVDELQEGEVIYLESNGNEIGRYKGQLYNGKKHGQGSYKFKSITYEGNFQSDKIKGEGCLSTPKYKLTGFFYSNSEIIENAPNLTANILYDNGDSFTGIISINQGNIIRENGTYKFSNGDIAQGHFNDNVDAKLEGNYLYTWKSGERRNY